MELSNAQKQVINTKNKSLLVSASAGSGKTFVVIERIIESIKHGADVSRLLVLTFTNAAASELKERLVSSLYILKDEYLAKGDRTNAVRIAKQISKVPMSDISTIHAFCLNIIRNNFYSLGIDPNITTLDQTQATIMLNDAINEVIENEYEIREEEFLDILDILGGEVNLINNIYMLFMAYNSVLKKDEWLDTILATYNIDENTDLEYTSFGKIIISSIKNRLNILKLELENTIEDLEGLEDFTSRQEMLKVILNNINLALNTNTYDDLYNIIPILQDSPRLPSTKVVDEELKEEVKSLKTRVTDEIKDIAKIIYKDSKGIINELNDVYKYVNWYIKIVKLVDEKYTLAKKEKCGIDFSDYEHLAFKALQDESVRSKYKEKYEQIYIDEYQDTSYAQEAILQMISREDNVIMVGDVKQSIYAFRHAKPELFSSKYEVLKDASEAENLKQAKIILAKNFRSRNEVLSSTNEIFTNLMSKNFGGARYEDKEALVYGADYDYSIQQNYKTEIHLIEKNLEDKELVKEETLTSIEKEAVLVAQRIKELVDNKFKIYDLKKKEYRDAKYKDVVILLKSVEGKADIVSKVLSSYNIPCFADSKTGFYSSEEISLVIAFLKVLDNPLEDISLVSVMYSIIGKFTLDELVIVRNKNMASSVLNSLKDAKETIEDEYLKNKIISFLELLERYKAYLRAYKISDLLIKLYSETGLYEALRIEKLGELKCANLDNFISIIANYEKTADKVSLHTLLRYLKVLKNKESSGDSPKLIGENEDVVRIMTIHKSKGLEFPVVILMNSAARYNEQDTSDKLQFDDELGLGIDILNKDLGIMYPSIIKQAIKAKTRKTLRAEALRLLYVAFTRAKEKLIVYGTVPNLDKYVSKLIKIKSKESSEFIASGYNSHLQCILQAAIGSDKNFEVVLHSIEDVANDSIEEKTLNRNENKSLALIKAAKKYGLKKDGEKIKELRNNLSCEYTPFSTNKKYTVTELKQSEINMQDLKPGVLTTKVTGTSYGTFIHAVIERLNYTSVTKDEILKTVESVSNELGMLDSINKNYVTSEISKMYEALKEYLEGAINIKNELEFVMYDDLNSIEEVKLEIPSLIQGVVDMLIVTKENKYIIIDFKTDKVENEKELIDKYKVQLKIYKKGIELNINKKVDATFIYSFSLEKLIEVK